MYACMLYVCMHSCMYVYTHIIGEMYIDRVYTTTSDYVYIDMSKCLVRLELKQIISIALVKKNMSEKSVIQYKQ